MKRIIMVTLGVFFLVLAFLGIFLPVLPTTPFVLLSAWLLSCSPRMLAMALRIPFFREHYENYKDRRGISKKTLVKSLVYLWLTMAVSAALVRRLWLACLLAVVGICVTVHLVHMSKARRKDVARGKDAAESSLPAGKEDSA